MTALGRPAAGAEDERLGALLRHARLACGLTQQKVADQLGITTQQLSKYEHGQNRLSAVHLFRLCRILRIRPDDLARDMADGTAPELPQHPRAVLDVLGSLVRLDQDEIAAVNAVASVMVKKRKRSSPDALAA